MNNNEAKIIKDEKFRYIIKTLSRTKRKDYENYVINAIWNRLNNNEIEIVTQQYINNPKDVRKHYFIDLYFPALNIGIECDEAQHLNQNNKHLDKLREINIFDILHEISGDGYIAKHIDVTRTFYEVEKQINQTVDFINRKIIDISPTKWELSAESYFKNKTVITIFDKKSFRTIDQTCNILFSANRSENAKGSRKSYFTPPKFKKTIYENYKLWFPQLAIKIIENGVEKIVAATKSGWNNKMNSDGTIIEEFNENENYGKKDVDKKRIVFTKYNDTLGNYAYKFVGIFEFDHLDNNGTRIFKRIADKCQLIKK
ncbi:MAG TPA: hypothetical protein PKY81_07380 [bacterium]|nr:hypothetical protein [bacterium]